jgi:ABC-type nitrate/sulfonate/bicarbonate transport system substrate-binding protein
MVAQRVRIGNVPEHFSSPLHIGNKRGVFKKHLVDVELVNCPGGTGEMIKMMQAKELDVVIALTEGLVSAIGKGCDDIAIIGTYVDAPLTWAISAGQLSRHTGVETLRGGTIGISRLGSGSHIMSFVLADQKGWLSDDDDDEEVFKFEILKDFKGLRDGVNNSAADAFMWEQFTTKPYHDKREVRRIGQITTPWPAFLIAVRKEVLDQDHEMINRLLVGITESCNIFMKEKESGQSVDYVAKTYGQKEDDVRAWFKTVRYAPDCTYVSEQVLVNCIKTLRKARVLTIPVDPWQLIDTRVAHLLSN